MVAYQSWRGRHPWTETDRPARYRSESWMPASPRSTTRPDTARSVLPAFAIPPRSRAAGPAGSQPAAAPPASGPCRLGPLEPGAPVERERESRRAARKGEERRTFSICEGDSRSCGLMSRNSGRETYHRVLFHPPQAEQVLTPRRPRPRADNVPPCFVSGAMAIRFLDDWHRPLNLAIGIRGTIAYILNRPMIRGHCLILTTMKKLIGLHLASA